MQDGAAKPPKKTAKTRPKHSAELVVEESETKRARPDQSEEEEYYEYLRLTEKFKDDEEEVYNYVRLKKKFENKNLPEVANVDPAASAWAKALKDVSVIVNNNYYEGGAQSVQVQGGGRNVMVQDGGTYESNVYNFCDPNDVNADV